jgi:hypothetical protein
MRRVTIPDQKSSATWRVIAWVLCRLKRLLDLGSKSSAGFRTHLEPTPLLIRHAENDLATLVVLLVQLQ